VNCRLAELLAVCCVEISVSPPSLTIPPFCDPGCAVAKLVGVRITVVEDIGFVAGRVRAGTGIEGGFPPTRHASKISSESEALFIVVALKRDNSQAAQRGT